jgi:hypothetical protein
MKVTPDDLERILKKHPTGVGSSVWPNSSQPGVAVAFRQLCKEIAPNLVFSSDDDRVDWMDRLGTLEFYLDKYESGPHITAIGTKFELYAGLHALAKKAWRGPGMGGVRELPFILDKELRGIAERDLASFESMTKAEEVKAAIVLAGSVIEAILFDLAEKDPAKTTAAAQNVKMKRGWKKFDPTDADWWTLEQVIAVCGQEGLGILSDRTEGTAHIARDYRNFVHPRKEREEAIGNGPLTRSDAIQAGALMELVIDQVNRWRAANP